MNRKKMVKLIGVSALLMVVLAIGFGILMSSAFGAEGEPVAAVAAAPVNGLVALAIAVSVASGAIGAGYAVGKVGSAAIGAASERPEMMGRALVFVVIAEGIAVWGLVGAILLLGALQ